MKATRKLSRRSFLGRVAGGAIGGGALTLVGGAGAAHPVSDNDSGAAGGDPVGGGRQPGQWPYADTDPAADAPGRPARLGHYTDSDTGMRGDPENHGRRLTDSDPADPVAYRPNLTDGDVGPESDPVGGGRRVRRR